MLKMRKMFKRRPKRCNVMYTAKHNKRHLQTMYLCSSRFTRKNCELFWCNQKLKEDLRGQTEVTAVCVSRVGHTDHTSNRSHFLYCNLQNCATSFFSPFFLFLFLHTFPITIIMKQLLPPLNDCCQFLLLLLLL